MAIPKSNVIVLDGYFRIEHKKAPRGFGEWWFDTHPYPKEFSNTITVRGLYSEAKKKAIEIAAERGCKFLYVLS